MSFIEQKNETPPLERGRSVRSTGWGSEGGKLFSRTEGKTGRARRLRSILTKTEQILWGKLRNKQIEGVSFRRQHPTGSYILDFYAPQLKLAIEVDGGQHGQINQRNKDARRDQWLKDHGVYVLRFWNNDVFENLDGVMEVIYGTVLELLNDWTPTLTLPLSGGGNAGEIDR